MTLLDPSLAHRDPARMLAQTRREWAARREAGESEFWVFGYASLIWRPEFEAAECRAGVVHGFHRALEMRSHVNRGTPQCPGLVFALVAGGSCRGMAYRIPNHRLDDEIERLWAREMVTGVYDPRWLTCRTTHGRIGALAFTLDRRSPNYTGALADDAVINILRQACGRYGTTLDYLVHTAHCLQGCGIRDREVERLVELARRHELVA